MGEFFIFLLSLAIFSAAVYLFFQFWIITFPLAFWVGWKWAREAEEQQNLTLTKKRLAWFLWALLVGAYLVFWLIALGIESWALIILLSIPVVFFSYHVGVEKSIQGALVKLGSWYHLAKYHLISEERTRLRKEAGIVSGTKDRWEELRYEREQEAEEPEDVREAQPVNTPPRSKAKKERETISVRDPVKDAREKSLIQIRMEAIIDSIKLRTAKQVYEDLAEYWQAVKKAHDAHLEAYQSMARSTPDELRDFEEEAAHQREMNKLHREIEREELELQRLRLKKERERMERPPEPPKSVDELVRETLEREFRKLDIIAEVLEERKREQISKLSEQLRLRFEEIERADLSPETKAWMRQMAERSIVQKIQKLLSEG